MLYLFAFDLDGTLLSFDKSISKSNINALREINDAGHHITLASGRLGSSIMNYKDILKIPFSTITLNGAAAYLGGAGEAEPLIREPLQKHYSEKLIVFSEKARSENEFGFILNFYHKDKLYTSINNRGSRWQKLYYHETKSNYNYVEDFLTMIEREPEKILLVGDEQLLDKMENEFRQKWDDEVYIVRTWKHYLEFLKKDINKGFALSQLATKLNIQRDNCIAFGDGDNDSEMIAFAGEGIAVSNGSEKVKLVAKKVSKWSNDEDAIAREWEIIKNRL